MSEPKTPAKYDTTDAKALIRARAMAQAPLGVGVTARDAAAKSLLWDIKEALVEACLNALHPAPR